MAVGSFGLLRSSAGLLIRIFLECRRSNQLPIAALVPGSAHIRFSAVASAGGIVEELIDQTWRRRNPADGEGGFTHTFQRGRECLHVRDLARHKELQRIDGALVVSKVN